MERVSGSDESYDAFAYAYDAGLGSTFFEVIEPLLRDVVDRYDDSSRIHLDLACGTGFATQWFAANGYRSFGLDLSLPMLQIARSRTARVVASDMRQPGLKRRFSRVTSLYDSLNHLLSESDLERTFREVHDVMTDDGLFLFDMNHPNAYDEVWSLVEPFVAEGDDFRLEIATRYDRRVGRAHGHVTGWARRNGSRVEIDEMHEQRPYGEKTISRLLRASGLQPIELLHFDPFGQGSSRGKPKIKMFFVVKRKN